jgi:hypothetical protein
MTKPTKTKVSPESVPTSKAETVSQLEWNPSDSVVKFVVVRDGFRVSDREYNAQNDAAAVAESTFWSKIARKYSDGTKVGVVQYDKKKHRIW